MICSHAIFLFLQGIISQKSSSIYNLGNFIMTSPTFAQCNFLNILCIVSPFYPLHPFCGEERKRGSGIVVCAPLKKLAALGLY